jgi:HAD superfamily hydrolase (TIGR01549 family)
MKIKPEAILFDMDGVLVDSVHAWLTSLNNTLDKFNHDKITRDDFIYKYWGHDLHNTLDILGVNQSAAIICNDEYKKNLNNVKLLPDVKTTLKKLNSYKKGIITNTPRNQTDMLLKKFDLNKYFNTIITSDDVNFGKPNPEIVIKACKDLDVKPSKVFSIGDTRSDIEAGKAAGCTGIGLNIQADYTVKKISDLIDILIR